MLHGVGTPAIKVFADCDIAGIEISELISEDIPVFLENRFVTKCFCGQELLTTRITSMLGESVVPSAWIADPHRSAWRTGR